MIIPPIVWSHCFRHPDFIFVMLGNSLGRLLWFLEFFFFNIEAVNKMVYTYSQCMVQQIEGEHLWFWGRCHFARSSLSFLSPSVASQTPAQGPGNCCSWAFLVSIGQTSDTLGIWFGIHRFIFWFCPVVPFLKCFF